jgi:hypothetical protein
MAITKQTVAGLERCVDLACVTAAGLLEGFAQNGIRGFNFQRTVAIPYSFDRIISSHVS